jgi:hypothetical protein
MTIKLRNTNREEAVTVRAADGDSVVIPAGATIPVADKFDWRLPRSVRKAQEAVAALASADAPNNNVGLSASASPTSGVTVSDT